LGRLKNKIIALSQYLSRDFNNPRTTLVFFKTLVVFAFIKIVMLWSLSHKVLAHHNITLPRSWVGKILFAPSFLANHNVDIFFGVALIFLAIAFLMSPNYVTTSLFFWLAFNVYIVYIPFANGADLVLFMLALWCIPMATKPKFKSETGTILQKTFYNSAIVLCQLQVIFIYLVSGWDKLFSPTWQTGLAFDYVAHLNTMYNPLFADVFDHPVLHLMLSWTTILFELVFVFLVWFEKTRLPMLLIGVLFHLFIWIVLSLPDFASTMMLSYIIFLKDADYYQVRNFFKR
jgi:hypothetical protein